MTRTARRRLVRELDQFEQGRVDLPPIIHGLESIVNRGWSVTEDWKAQFAAHVADLKSIYTAVAANCEPWRYHEIQTRLRETATFARLCDSIAALKELLRTSNA